VQRGGALRIAAVDRAVGQLVAERLLLFFQRLDAAGQGVELALVLVAELGGCRGGLDSRIVGLFGQFPASMGL
jgi:hypothetical protein